LSVWSPGGALGALPSLRRRSVSQSVLQLGSMPSSVQLSAQELAQESALQWAQLLDLVLPSEQRLVLVPAWGRSRRRCPLP